MSTTEQVQSDRAAFMVYKGPSQLRIVVFVVFALIGAAIVTSRGSPAASLKSHHSMLGEEPVPVTPLGSKPKKSLVRQEPVPIPAFKTAPLVREEPWVQPVAPLKDLDGGKFNGVAQELPPSTATPFLAGVLVLQKPVPIPAPVREEQWVTTSSPAGVFVLQKPVPITAPVREEQWVTTSSPAGVFVLQESLPVPAPVREEPWVTTSSSAGIFVLQESLPAPAPKRVPLVQEEPWVQPATPLKDLDGGKFFGVAQELPLFSTKLSAAGVLAILGSYLPLVGFVGVLIAFATQARSLAHDLVNAPHSIEGLMKKNAV